MPTQTVTENTSALTFKDLILEVAFKLGLAYYGATGVEEPQIPIDPHDLITCKRIVNDAIRMFIHDAPKPGGWHWLDIVGQVDIWPQIASDQSLTTKVTGEFMTGTGLTRLTLHQPAAGTASFVPSMEYRRIWLGGNPPVGTPGFNTPISGADPNTGTQFTITRWVSLTQVDVFGNATAITGATGCSYSLASTGDYTMPANFGGQYSGDISYIANTNRGMVLHWITEAQIRQRRQNYNIESGTPFEAAIRQMPLPTQNELDILPRRQRWELMTWRISSEFLSLLFPYILHFDQLVELTDIPPAPIGHDESIKAACLAVAEKKVEDAYGPDWQYYRETCLPNSYAVDARSQPRKLGYFGNPTAAGGKYPAIQTFRDYWYQRPTVPVT